MIGILCTHRSFQKDGYFWFFSRTDDLIISSGYRIGGLSPLVLQTPLHNMSGPFEVESALIEHEAVLESAVVPRSFLWPFYLLFDFLLFISPDVERGQVVKAFVVLSDRFSEVSMSSLVKNIARIANAVQCLS